MKKINRVKWFVLGVAVAIMMSVLVVPGLAASLSKEATLYYRNIKITLNGQEIVPKDASGTVVEPFVIDGTTYLPVRAIANALGMGVLWDDPTSTVKLTDDERLTGTVDITGVLFYYDEGQPCVYLELKNNLTADIAKVTFEAYCYDKDGNMVGNKTSSIFVFETASTIAVGGTSSARWFLTSFPGTESIKYSILEYATTDGTVVAIPRAERTWYVADY